MRFNPPPGWPSAPDGWMPDPGWAPNTDWPAAPTGWRFWVNDYDVPVDGPYGLYGAKKRRFTGAGLILAAAAGVVGILIGTGGSGAGDDPQLSAAPVVAEVPQAIPTVTTTVKTAGPTVTATKTLKPKPAPTVTKTKVKTRTVTKTVAPVAPLVDPGTSSVYYENCDAVRAAGADPLYSGDPGYASHLDRDGDGVACE